ncbi:MAG: hypothetical protein U9N87_05750, partial [Planctomycetota bacterium]|nr:hypothetical protein [Planctomycetota bacterium]
MNTLIFSRKLFSFAAIVLAMLTALAAASSGFAGEFTLLDTLPAAKIIDSATEYHNGRYPPQNILMDGPAGGSPGGEFATEGKGTDTFIVFDFGKPVTLCAITHVDRSDYTTVTGSSLTFSNTPDFKQKLGTVKIKHSGEPLGRVFKAFKPVTARYVRWQVLALGPKGHKCVGGTRMHFYAAGSPVPLAHAAAHDVKTMKITPLQAVMKKDGKRYTQVRATFKHDYLQPLDATVQIADETKQPIILSPGKNTILLNAPVVARPCDVAMKLQVAGKTLSEKTVRITPVRPWKLYYLPHSHVDIGYTHVQTDVMKRQWDHFELAMDIAEKTADYPHGARFKWNAEVLWAVDSYLKEAPADKKKRFLAAVRKGAIGIDALYGNELTALCRPEELMRLLDCANRLREDYGMEIDSAMISDVPGYTWGMVPVLAQNGIKYFSVGPNHCHRIGLTLDTWGDKPFYWVGPAGKHKVLFWMHGKGYAWYLYERGLDEAKIFRYLDKLVAEGYPYDMLPVRYTIGADNGPPDPKLPEFVKAWNAKYEWPKIEISTTSPVMREFAKAYGDKLPEVSGDFTPYWEDGAGSTARETARARVASDRLVQAEALWAMLRPRDYPDDDFYRAWRNVMLYNEHTWGAHCSISKPDDPFTRSQWAIKRNFAVEGEKQSKALVAKALGIKDTTPDGPIAAADVYNTCSWPRTDLVLLPAGAKLAGESVKTSDGKALRSQRLACGQLAVLVEDVPPFAAQRILFETATKSLPKGKAVARATAVGNTLGNGLVTLSVDKQRGSITELKTAAGHNLVDTSAGVGLNEYLYQAGRKPGKLDGTSAAKITVEDDGPLVAALSIESHAPGCKQLVRRLRVVDGLNRVDIADMLDKQPVRSKESVHLGFAFDVPGGRMRIDTPWAVTRPELDQLPGSCKNYLTVGRWIDISNKDFGVTWATLDAPLVEVGRVSVDVPNPMSLDGWITKLEASNTFFSYVMNNYWETN